MDETREAKHGAPPSAEPLEQVQSQRPIPNGGLEAWLSVFAVFCVFVNSWGLISTYGAFQEFYQTVLLPNESPSSISWVGSIQATLVVMVGIVSGPLVDLGYLRPLIISGSFLVVFGMMMTSLATQYYQVILAQGFCVGIGGGIAYIPALVVISILSFYMVAIINGASAFGRTVPYLLGSRVKPIGILITCVAGSAIAMFTWTAATNIPGFIVWACYWGFLTGVLVTGPTSIVSHPALCPDLKMLGTRMGMMWGISSLGSLAGTPIAGTLVELSEANFLRAQIFAGCMMVGAVALQSCPTFVIFRYDRKGQGSQ
ncbi:uncharacterized protein DSM5745_07917 [Aspergillus mulundensis]|uniref:Major facilitator superfamily (MFS) profile domain-containing protein n=1 Tax=Aspergillus mulundensis TaxID=1810919 RepID=A0A3D8RFC2_9EURO|nr:hypothetical protein DSM5745_07917 [Aspergillus mulundensis]RDW72745.1 hypothetical protein DSM5745_07917 [Aspergillus mulundensis]